MATISCTSTLLTITRTPFHTKDFLRILPGARWDSDVSAWEFPRSASTLKALLSAFPDAQLGAGVKKILEEESRAALALAAKHAADPAEPPSTKLTPWLHQSRGYWFATLSLGLDAEGTTLGGGAMLGMDMGTGKTKVVFDLLNSLTTSLVLVACPKAVCQTWVDEAAKHSMNRVSVLKLDEGSVKRKARDAERFLTTPASSRMVVINHESLWREPFRSLVKATSWDMLVVDECHRAKAPGGKLSRFLGTLSTSIPMRMGLTGTPMPRDPMDIYAQARFLSPALFGTSFARFKSRYGIWGGFENRKFLRLRNEEEFNQKMDQLCYRVRARDVLDLPPVSHHSIKCSLSAEENAYYQEMKRELVIQVKSGLVTAGNALVKLLRLQQIVQGTVTDDSGTKHRIGNTKQDAFKELLGDLPVDEPVVVFARFRDDLDRIRAVADGLGRGCLELSGRVNNLEWWKKGNAGEVLAVQIQSGGVGVDLTRACYTIYYSPTFDMGAYEQSLARTHRPGQTRPTFYYHLLATGTVDIKIHAALAQKKKVVDEVLAGLLEE
ncbi:MAG: DEAD/DEAH box helicase [Gammaproteobacteria bacterium]|nr:DEAD/DEAH box helicase [Gammaproteobacteria bacterium]